ARDVADLEALVVLVHQGTLVGLCVVAIEVEEAGIPLVGAHVERPIVSAPALERRLDLLALGRRSQVPLPAVCSAYVQMVVLVAAAVARVEDPIVLGEVADGVGGVAGRSSELRRASARYRHRAGVEDAALVRGEQDPL